MKRVLLTFYEELNFWSQKLHSVQALVHSVPGIPSESSNGFYKNTIDQVFLSVAQTGLSTLYCALLLPAMRMTLYLCLVNAHIDKQSQKAFAQFLFWGG